MRDSDAVDAIRTRVAMSRAEHLRMLWVEGEDAFDLVDRIVPRKLYLRDGQVLPSVLLGSDARIFADVYIGLDDDRFMLIFEGPDHDEMIGYLTEHAPEELARCDVDVLRTHAVTSIDGPYAWELLSELLGDEIFGLPYMTFYALDEFDGLFLRAGKTGEFGYVLIAPRDQVDEFDAACRAVGEAFGLAEADLAALDQCALENWFFNIRREGRRGLTPIEAQLQWRVSYDKPYAVGMERLGSLRGSEHRRLCTIVGAESIDIDQPITLGGAEVGTVVNSGWSQTLDACVALALTEARVAHPGHEAFATAGGQTVRTVSPPLINNRSLYVNPQRHSYESRHHDDFPPLI